MRDFTDENGDRWDVTLGRESWGAFYALFVRRGPARAGTRRTMLEETSQIAATRALMSMSENGLAELFRASRVDD